MTHLVIEALALEVILGLPSGTQLSVTDLQHEIDRRLPAGAPVSDAAATAAAARYLMGIGYLQVSRDEPALFRVP